MIDQQNMQVKNGSTWHTICPFPVGFIYLAATSTSPGITFGGTWAALSSGYFLRPAGTFSGTGGEATHTLTTDEMPAHSHHGGSFGRTIKEASSFGVVKSESFANRVLVFLGTSSPDTAISTTINGGGILQQSAALSKCVWMEKNCLTGSWWSRWLP